MSLVLSVPFDEFNFTVTSGPYKIQLEKTYEECSIKKRRQRGRYHYIKLRVLNIFFVGIFVQLHDLPLLSEPVSEIIKRVFLSQKTSKGRSNKILILLIFRQKKSSFVDRTCPLVNQNDSELNVLKCKDLENRILV